MDITFKQLEIFRCVVVAGSITKASHRIGLSQPSISQQLAKLEESLNVQLINRNRTGMMSMTPAGEFWFKMSEDMIGRMTGVMNEHEQRFRRANSVLKLGTTAALGGRFSTAVAQIALREPNFIKFELIHDINSVALVEQLRMQRINFAVVAESALAADLSSFATARLYDDTIAWAVPAGISDDALRYALSPDADPARIDPALKRYVEIDPGVPTRSASDDWYRHRLPAAMPAFCAPTFAASVDFVAEGLATCHIPLTLLPNLSSSVRSRMKLFVIDSMTRTVILAMRKHLLSHAAFARIFRGVTEFCQTEYANEMTGQDLRTVSALLAPTPPVLVNSWSSRSKMPAIVGKPLAVIGEAASR